MESLLLIQDEITPAGYAKLQWTENGMVSMDTARDNCAIDFFGRPVLANNVYFEDMTHDHRSGPAGTTLAKRGFTDLDYVPAFQCTSWPTQAKPWIHKFRSLKWPSVETINDFKTYGCFLVPVGQPFSSEKELQWRLSFSIQERKLMMALNAIQYKSYVCMKMIKNDFIKPFVKGKALTSYHCKTCLFYMLEVTEEKFWTEENLIYCVQMGINTLKTWVQNRFIPNYFIPEENMWKGSNEAQSQLLATLDGILQQGPGFVFQLHCDHLGKLIMKTLKVEVGTESLNSYQKYMRLHNGDNRDRNYKLSGVELSNSPNIHDQNINSVETSNICTSTIKDKEVDGTKSNDSVCTQQLGHNREEAVEIFDEMLLGYKEPISESQNLFQPHADLSLPGQASQKESEQFVTSQHTACTLQQQGDTEDMTHSDDDSNEDNSNTTDIEIESMLHKASRSLDLAVYKIHHHCIGSILGNGRDLLQLLRENDDIEASIIEHQSVIEWFRKQTHGSKVYTEEEMLRAIDYLLPVLYSSLGSHIAAKAFNCNDNETKRQELIDLSLTNLFKGHTADAQSGKVKLAAALFMFGNYSECGSLLQNLHDNYDENVTTWGRCYKDTDFVNEALCNKIRNEMLTTTEILQESSCGCVTYLPAEIDIVPDDLKYEYFRSVFSVTPKIPEKEDYFDSVHVDSTVYLYYLRYRLYEKQGRSKDQRHALAMMGLILQEDLNLGHPDTANNLFGRILMEMGEIRAAWQCFSDSWKIRPDHNAAKWHMAIMLSETVEILNDIEKGLALEEKESVTVLYDRAAAVKN